MEWNALVPELVVADYERSKAFYVDVFGFSVRFERPESRFGYFDLGGAQIMLLEDTNRPIYQMHRAGPKGKGLHFQIEIPAISGILERLNKASIPLASDRCGILVSTGHGAAWTERILCRGSGRLLVSLLRVHRSALGTASWSLNG